MLVLTRKKGEAIQIGDNIQVKVLAVEGDQIKIGIDAPEMIDIYRREIFLAIQEQNNEAANVSLDLLNLLKDDQKS